MYRFGIAKKNLEIGDLIKKEDMEVAHIILAKNGRSWDMRFKENKKWAKIMFPKKPWYDKALQKIANKLGSPMIMGGHTHWKWWLNPIWQFQQWRWRHFDSKKPIQFDKFI